MQSSQVVEANTDTTNMTREKVMLHVIHESYDSNQRSSVRRLFMAFVSTVSWVFRRSKDLSSPSDLTVNPATDGTQDILVYCQSCKTKTFKLQSMSKYNAAKLLPRS